MEVDGQGVVFNVHWLTYFDDSCTRFMSSLGFGPGFWIKEFDVMLVKAEIEWVGPGGLRRMDRRGPFAPSRIGTKSFDLSYRAAIEGTRRLPGDDHVLRGAPRFQRAVSRFPTPCALLLDPPPDRRLTTHT